MTEANEYTVYDIDPALILADDNARFNLRTPAVDRLANEILEHGGVHTPAEVEQLDTEVDGKSYRLTVGHYRLAAVLKLNAEQNAGLPLPCLIRAQPDALTRLKRQLSENVDRENLSPMDAAVAIDKLFKAGVSRLDIRTVFARPGKGGAIPASNSWINCIHRLLELPKSIQEKVHSGLVGFMAAYELGKVSPDKREAVLARALAEHQADVDTEAKDEAKFLADEKKALELVSQADETEKAAEAARVEAEIAEKRAEKLAADAKGMKVNKKVPKKVQKEQGAKLAKAKDAAAEAAKAVTTHQKSAEKLAEQAKALREKAAQRLKVLTEGRAAKKAQKKTKGVSPEAVKRAAAAETGGAVPLNAAQMRAAVKELAVVAYPTVSKIGELLQSCFDGVTTPAQLLRSLAELVKEPNLPKPRPVKK